MNKHLETARQLAAECERKAAGLVFDFEKWECYADAVYWLLSEREKWRQRAETAERGERVES